MVNTSAIDFEHLRTYTGGDTAVEQEILGVFIQQADIWVRMLQSSDDDKAWVDAAHSLKGSARGVGAWRVAEICEQAEQLADDSTLEERDTAIDNLKTAIADTVYFIQQHLDQD